MNTQFDFKGDLMKDMAEKELSIGDRVVLNSKSGSSYGKNKLHFGTVEAFTKTKVRVRSNYRNGGTILKDPDDLYIVLSSYHGSDL